MRDVPLGITIFQKITDKCCPRLRFNREWCYRSSVLFLTYISYMCYHMSRKPISVVKNVLHQNCSNLTPPANVQPDHLGTWCDWAPFDGADASQLLGTLDSAFLFAYAAAMFVSGIIAERVNLRLFLAVGMIFSGIFSYLFGIARSYGIHNLSYFIVVQAGAGIFQTTGWPGVVTIVGNWFEKKNLGLIYGIWNSHTSVGNILGTVIAAKYVETDWSMSFILPGLLIAVSGFIIFFFLVTNPADVGCMVMNRSNDKENKRFRRPDVGGVARPELRGSNDSGNSSETDDTDIIIGEQEVQRRITERTPILRASHSNEVPQEDKAIGFLGALRIPGVIEYSLSLFFAKLVSYTFLYWLPNYIKNSTTLGAETSADLSTLFDVGGIIGAIAAGVISDKSRMSATTCVGMLLAAIPMMFVYEHFGTYNLGSNMLLLFAVGILVNGPYALITTAVSADLGTHPCLGGNSKALATVTAIIDGTGSIGAAVGPLLAGFVSNMGWCNVFYMLMISDLLALILLLRLARAELAKLRQNRRLLPSRIN